MSYRVIFSPEAQEQLAELYHYIAEAGSPQIAMRYTEAVVRYCERLCTFPLRGTRRDDERPALPVGDQKRWPDQAVGAPAKNAFNSLISVSC